MEPDEAVRLRRVITMLARQFNTSATDEGLTPSQASVLGLVVGRGPISLAELVRMENINPTMLSRVVGKLDEAQMVMRVPDPNDLRSASLTATDHGCEVHERIRAQRADAVARSADHLSIAHRAAIVRALPALERLADDLGAS